MTNFDLLVCGCAVCHNVYFYRANVNQRIKLGEKRLAKRYDNKHRLMNTTIVSMPCNVFHSTLIYFKISNCQPNKVYVVIIEI